MVELGTFPRGQPGASPDNFTAPDTRWKSPATILGGEDAPFWAYSPGKIFLGALDGRLIGIDDNRHIMTVAGSRAGKSVSALVPNLIDYPGSVLVIDPKGELAHITAHRRGPGWPQCPFLHGRNLPGLGQRVYVLDPFNRAADWLDDARAAYNPLDIIEPDSRDAVENAGMIADAIVIRDAGGKDPHWDESALAFLEGLILHVATWPDYAAQRHLLTVRALVTADMDVLQAEMEQNAVQAADADDPRTIVGRAASDFFNKPEGERGSVLSTVKRHTKFLDGPAMPSVLSHSDFALDDLKREPVTIYLSLPATRLGTHSRWLRLFVNLVLEAMERTDAKPDYPVLLILDEFATLGHMRQIENAAGQMAGFGVKLWPILQDLGQLKSLYQERWETFMGNAGLLEFFGNNDITTLEWISKRLGKTTVVLRQKTEVTPGASKDGAMGFSWTPHVHQLMELDEIADYFSRDQNTMIAMRPGTHPIALDRVAYFRHPYFFGKYVDPAGSAA